MPATFPPLKSLDRQPHNLPAQPTALIGREQELATLHELLTDAETRLTTLVGPGGTGKTRLALQAAAEVLDHFPDGVWWVPLATVADPELVPQAIATPLGVRESPVESLLESVAAHLRSRQILLLLDNLEHLLAAAPRIERLLDDAPQLAILATSREPLRLRAEREFPVDPLPLPQEDSRVSLSEALAAPAVRLFLERAQAVKPSFALDAHNVTEVVAICRRLDGLPLAIELAAARVRMLPPAALLARLHQRLAVLTGGARDLPPRQQTLRAAITWSYDLLLPPERTFFARLGVFAGGCTLEAAEAVCSAAGGLPLDLLEGIDSLVQKSLLRQENGPAGSPASPCWRRSTSSPRSALRSFPRPMSSAGSTPIPFGCWPRMPTGTTSPAKPISSTGSKPIMPICVRRSAFTSSRAPQVWQTAFVSALPLPTSGGCTGISPKDGAYSSVRSRNGKAVHPSTWWQQSRGPRSSPKLRETWGAGNRFRKRSWRSTKNQATWRESRGRLLVWARLRGSGMIWRRLAPATRKAWTPGRERETRPALLARSRASA